jgi:hypothetical protein
VNEEGAPFDSGFDDAGPFSDTPEADGVALDAALREFGPAAFDDLVPRLQALAAELDAAHSAGFVHGRLHPSRVFVTDAATYLLGARVPLALEAGGQRRWPITPPYTAPEVVEGGAPGPMADQFSLAAITYEWMFGRPITGPAGRTIEVRAIPAVDRAELARAFTRALTPEPFRRFASCTDFCGAIAASSASTAPSLPLLALDDHHDDDEVLGPFVPETPARPEQGRRAEQTDAPAAAAAPVPDLSFSPEPDVPAHEPDLDSFQPVAAPLGAASAIEIDAPPTAAPHRASGERFSGVALILATIVGAVFGFAAGYMARPRALQTPPPAASLPIAPAEAPQAPQAPKAPQASQAPQAPSNIGRLLIRSTPNGASVEVDGVARGVTPLTLRDLDLGSRAITLSRPGYVDEERRIVLTEARPSRTVDVRLTAVAPAARATARPSTPAAIAKPAATTGSLAVESRPTGAAVTIDGKPGGVTPLIIGDLSPGEYRVVMTLPGYRPFATTVRVVAGERARAAARLTEQEQE